MVRDALKIMKDISPDAANWQQQKFLISGVVPKVHKPLLKRGTCSKYFFCTLLWRNCIIMISENLVFGKLRIGVKCERKLHNFGN